MPLSAAVLTERNTGLTFIGTILNVCLQGIMTMQCFLYYTQFKRDSKWLKLFVTFLFFADLAHSVFMVTYLYNALINHFGDVEYLLIADWVFAAEPALTGIIACSAELFYAWRILVLTGRRSLVAVVSFTAILGCVAAIGSAIYVHYYPNFLTFQKFKYMVCIWLISEVTSDIIITCSLVWHLRAHKGGFAASNDIIDKLIRLTLQTGLLTTVWALIELILYLVYPSALHILFGIVLSKLYTNSLMSTLNSRGGWKFSQTSEPSSAYSGSSTDPTFETRKGDVIHLQVQMHSESAADTSPPSKGEIESIEKADGTW